MAAFSGRKGSVQANGVAVAEVINWSFNPTSNNPAWASSSSPGYKQRKPGVKDGSGSVTVKFDDSSGAGVQDFLQYGAAEDEVALTLKLYLNDTQFFSIPAVIDGISYEVDINDGEVVEASFDFSINGEWTDPL